MKIGITIIALVLSIPLTNITFQFFDKPAVRIMKMVTGGNKKKFEFDDSGIPKVFYPKLKKAFYNPVQISHTAIDFYERMEPGVNDPGTNYSQFIKYAIWLKNNLRQAENEGLTFGVWEYHFPWANYQLEAPWRSGMAQGAGIEVLYAAYKTTKNDEFLSSAENALKAFFVEVGKGGVTYKDSPDDWWFEEYAGSNNIESRVLNGAIYALIDIYDFWKNTENKNAEILYKYGLAGIKKNLEKYDAGWWSYYDLSGNIATLKYHNVHINLLNRLYKISGEPVFKEYAEKWAGYNASYFKREFLEQSPDYHDLVIWALTFLCLYFPGVSICGIYWLYKIK